MLCLIVSSTKPALAFKYQLLVVGNCAKGTTAEQLISVVVLISNNTIKGNTIK